MADDVAMVDLPGDVGSEGVVGGIDEQPRVDGEMEQGFVKIERARRTDTEGTLVGYDNDESEIKELED